MRRLETAARAGRRAYAAAEKELRTLLPGSKQVRTGLADLTGYYRTMQRVYAEFVVTAREGRAGRVAAVMRSTDRIERLIKRGETQRQAAQRRLGVKIK